MGQGSKFDSALSTRGGKCNLITASDIAAGDSLAKEILKEMKDDRIKYSKDKIVFAARLANGNKIFLERDAVNHIVLRHADDFKNAFGVERHEISSLLSDTISKGKLISSFRKDSNGKEGYRNVYYYKGRYTVVYSIASNGYIETAFPDDYYGG